MSTHRIAPGLQGCALALALFSATAAQAQIMFKPVVLHSFTGQPNGSAPYTPPVYRDGKVYGVAGRGGAGAPTNPLAYSVNAAGGGFAGQSFPAQIGISPHTNLSVDSKGNLYGGVAGSPFTVYRLPAGMLAPVALSTTGLALGTGLKGIWSIDRTAGSANFDALYFAGTASDTPSLFRLGANGTPAAIKTFTKYDSAPSALLAASDGWLYGVTGPYVAGMFGGTKGYIYRIRPDDAATFEIMKSFDATTGYPAVNNTQGIFSGLVEGKDGWLYGTTYSNGVGSFVGDGADGKGIAYRIRPARDAGGFAFETLHTFGTGAGDGTHAGGQLALGDDGYVYGTTYQGGDSGNGALYRIVTANAAQAGGGYEKLASFGGATDGKLPTGLTLGADHKLYGAASGGGAGNLGTVFQVDIGYVAPAARIVAFTASPTAVTLTSDGKPSGATTLNWQTENATACTASGAWTGAKSASGSGSEQLLPAIEGANAYTLSCTGAGGDATATATVTATRAPASGGGSTPSAGGTTPASSSGGGGPLAPAALLALGAAWLARRRARRRSLLR